VINYHMASVPLCEAAPLREPLLNLARPSKQSPFKSRWITGIAPVITSLSDSMGLSMELAIIIIPCCHCCVPWSVPTRRASLDQKESICVGGTSSKCEVSIPRTLIKFPIWSSEVWKPLQKTEEQSSDVRDPNSML
jgi:hypothetical protein